MSEEKGKGRPTKWHNSLKPVIKNLAAEGKTNREIALLLGVDEKTFYNWKEQHVEFFQSLKDVYKAKADSNVEKSLYERAKGYSVEEVKILQDKRGNVIEHKVMKHYPPDPTSMIFWLKNRQPEKWRDKRDIGLENTEGKSFKLSYSTDKKPEDKNDNNKNAS